jgi:hypothetical protein
MGNCPARAGGRGGRAVGAARPRASRTTQGGGSFRGPRGGGGGEKAAGPRDGGKTAARPPVRLGREEGNWPERGGEGFLFIFPILVIIHH